MAKKPIGVSIKKYLEVLKTKNIRVNKAILYGSYANGKADKDSDISLGVALLLNQKIQGRNLFRTIMITQKNPAGWARGKARPGSRY